MGQYHKFMNFDKKEILNPPGLLKLMEWSYQRNEYMLQVENLLKTSWKGDRVLVIGDYADDFYEDKYSSELLKTIREENKEYGVHNIYDYPYREIKNTSADSNKLPSRYINNDSLKEYIDLKKQLIQWVVYEENKNLISGAKIHPLSLALSCCNGAGGGDYYAPNAHEVGCWITSSNNISLSDELKEGYKDSGILFNEYSDKENNVEIIIDYMTENFKITDIKKIEKIKFSPSLFLDDDEKKHIIEQSIKNIKEKELKLDNKDEQKDKIIQDIKDLVMNYEEEIER